MIVRKILSAAATGGIGYYPVGNPTDAYYDNVSLLLNGDVEVDSNFANVSLLLDGNTLADKSNNKITVTANGNAVVSNTTKKFGTGSLYFDGNGDYLTTPSNSTLNLAGGNWTIEFWAYYTGADFSNYRHIVTKGDAINGPCSYQAYLVTGTGYISFYNGTVYSSTTVMPKNQWCHLAYVYSGSTLTIYLDGTSICTSTATISDSTSQPLNIGNYSGDLSMGYIGYIDDIRITKGVARYTTNFTPPVKALPTHEILDSSVYRLPVTAVGNARIDTATKKFGTGAMYFDGSGDYLTLPNSSGLLFGTDNFTIEFWFRQSTAVSAAAIFCNSTNSSVFNANWFYIHANHPTYPNKFCASAYNITSSVPFIAGTTDIVNDNWYHVALVRSSTAFSLYVNGALEGTATSSASIDGNTVYSKYVGGAGDGGLIVNGYIDDLRITKGIARYTANFPPGPTASLPTIPPTISADPWWGNVSLLLDGNTTDAYDPYWQNVSLMLTGDDFIDWSNQHNAVTNNGTVTLDTTNKKFNSSSLSFNGSSQYFNLPSASGFNTDNFTIEFWIRPSSVNTTVSFISNRVAGAADTVFVFGYSNAANVGLFFHTQNTVILNTNTFLTQNSWQHVAAVRISGNLKIYLDGNLVGTAAMSQNLSSTNALYIAKDGTKSDGGQTGLFAGQIADLRITKGIARTITVPPAALPSYKIQDRTQNNLTLTPYGNVQLSTDVMKNGTGSMFFDGTGDYLSIPNNVGFRLLGDSFTVEFWVYFNVGWTNRGLVGIHDNSSDGWFLRTTGTALRVYNNGGGANDITTSFNTGQWYHIAWSSTGTSSQLFINGVSIATVATSGVNNTANNLQIGQTTTVGDYFNGYIDDLRITKGYARYTQNFTPPSQSFATQYISTGYDANYADVSLLLNGNGTNGSQVFTDLSSSPKTITVYGNAQISTAVKKYGTGAMAFDGSGDYFSVPYSTNLLLNSVNSTLEGWFYLNASPGGPGSTAPFFCQTDITNSSTSGGSNFWCFADSTNIYFGGGGQSSYLTAAVSNIPISQWFHLAIVITAGVSAAVYINGVSKMSGTIDAIGSNSAYSTFIGACKTGVPPGTLNSLNGYADDLRITKGIARYTTNFTPPTYQLPTDTTGTVIDPLRSSTSLLLRGNGTNGSTSFTDESPNGLTVTNNGLVTVNTTTKKYGTGSMAFSGSNYLSVPCNSIFDFGTGDFTLEAWIYVTASTVQGLFDTRSGQTATNYIWNFESGPKLSLYLAGTYCTTTNNIPTNQWVHVATVRASGIIKHYVNGIVDNATGFSQSGIINSNNTTALIGRLWDSAAYYLNGCIDDLRITKGYARYTANFTPPTYEDPIVTGTVYDYNHPQVSLLLNGDGTNGSTVFKDLSSSPKTITNNGSVTVNTTTKKFGTGSIAFSGSNYLSIASSTYLALPNEFTVECWVYCTVAPVYSVFLGIAGGIQIGLDVNGYLAIALQGVTFQLNSTTTVPLNIWNHIAVTRNTANAVNIYLNGISVASGTISTSYSAGDAYINYNLASTGSKFTGYLDDLRITKGLARYTQNFTPPTAPLPTSYS